MKKSSTLPARFALTGVAAAALSLAAPGAWALGLGKLAVQSALGESLRAEIDVTSLTPEEASNLRVRVAQPDAYRTAGIDYNAVLPSTQVVLQRRPDGRPYLRLTSDRSVQEPFIDVILELNWSSGRLVREYTLLFDPPNTARASPPPAAASAATPSGVTAAAPMNPVETAAAPRPAERRVAPSRAAVEPPAAVAAAPAVPPIVRSPAIAATTAPRALPAGDAASAGIDEYRVRTGDSLSRIATRTQRPGVSLDQMLVSLYRGNPQAFVDSNMNRLRSGVTLSVPSAESAQAVPPLEARQVIQAQSADFGAYRQRLAAGVPTTQPEGNTRQASGKVQASVDDRRQTAAPAPDRLTLSKGAASGAASQAVAADDRISKDRERREAAARVAELSKNVAELKNLKGATSAQTGTTATSSAPASPVPATPGPTVVAAAPQAAPAVAPPASTAAPRPGIAPAASSSGILVAAPPILQGTAPAASRPAAAARPASAAPVAPRPPVEEPGVLGSLVEDNALAFGLGGLLLLLLAGLGVYRLTRRPKIDSGETSFLESRLQPDSFFGASGGQRIDTRDAGGASSSMSYSLSQLDAIGDVDPVAEADVYLAYGRDLQAEEILKEAMRSNPERMAIRTKLLEVYAKRRDTKGFELLATQLFALTRGEGEDWAKAQELGAQIDPENPLFQPGGAPPMAADGGRIVELLGASTMPQSVLPTTSQFGPSTSAPMPLQSGHGDLDVDLDLDLDVDVDVDHGGSAVTTAPSPLDASHPHPVQPAQASAVDPLALDFTVPGALPAPPPPVRAAAPAVPPPEPESRDFDVGGMSLDLDLPDLASPPPRSRTIDFSFDDADSTPLAGADDDPLARKLELAEEFRQIGDTDGARDLLEEVIAKASGSVKTRAEGMLANLSS